MRATVMYRAGDVRIENVPDAPIVNPTDAVIRITRACSKIEPGRVFDRVIGLDQVPDGYRAMNERKALKVMVKP